MVMPAAQQHSSWDLEIGFRLFHRSPPCLLQAPLCCRRPCCGPPSLHPACAAGSARLATSLSSLRWTSCWTVCCCWWSKVGEWS